MLPARRRLRASAEIRAVVRGGRRFVSRDIVLHVRVDPLRAGGARVCVIVSKAVGNAVERNLVRRRLREAARQLIEGMPSGADVVVRARESARDASFSRLTTQLSQLISRIGAET